MRKAPLPLLLAVLGLFSATAASPASPVPEALAQTPPMRWNSYNHFYIYPTDQDIRDAADQIVASGMKDAGYVYVNIDSGWEGARDASGVIHSNPVRFPDMKALADYVHSKGLKIGIYSSPGPTVCGGGIGSYGHEEQDAQTFADWGIDYLKYDLCSFLQIMQQEAPNDPAAQMNLMHAAYQKMDKALKATGRPIVYSFCEYGFDAVWEWAPSLGANLWRTAQDLAANWYSIYWVLGQQDGLQDYAGPGHWNDPDMLQVGNGNMSLAENRSHFSMWAMLEAPLLAGNDLTNMPPQILDILTNKDVIAIDQDRLGRPARHVYSQGEIDVWERDLSDGAKAIAVLDVGVDRYSTHPFHLNLARLGLHGPQRAKNLWTGSDITLTDSMPIEIASHDTLLLRIDEPCDDRDQ